MPGSHPGLLANQTLSDEYCRPSQYKLRLRRLGTDVYMFDIVLYSVCYEFLYSIYV